MSIIRKVLNSLEMRRLYSELLKSPDTEKRVGEILEITDADLPPSLLSEGERSLPGNPEFVKNGWSRVMLTRYALALRYAEGKKVLDCCSGLGWGAHILCARAAMAAGADLNLPALRFAKQKWRDENFHPVRCNVLHLPFDSGEFDLVACMESIEHFTRERGLLLLREIKRVMKRGGRLVGSSYFARSAGEAKQVAAKNPHHHHIWTRDDFQNTLSELWDEVYIYPNRLFFHAF